MAARRLAAFALLGASVAVAFLGAELFLRWQRPPQASRIVYPCFFLDDRELGYRYAPDAEARVAGHFEIDNLARTNSLGFHDAEPLPAGETSWRLLAVGDSFTAGLNLPREDVWTAVLEREIRSRGFPTADVVNLGIDGTGTDAHLELIEAHAPRLRPDSVLLAFYANDLLDVLHGRFRRECHRGFVLSYQDDLQRMVLRARVDAHLERGVLLRLFENSWLLRVAIYAAEGPRNLFRMNFLQTSLAELGIDESVRRARRKRFPALVRGLEAVAASCGCRVVVVPVPGRGDPGGSLAVLRSQLGELPVEVLDVAPAMATRLSAAGRPRSDLYWENDNHLNAYGNELFGRAVADALLRGPTPRAEAGTAGRR